MSGIKERNRLSGNPTKRPGSPSSMLARALKPTKAGSLGKLPLAHLMVYFEQHAWSGSLWIYDDTRAHDSTVLFVDGAPAKIRTSLAHPRLGELLVELGFLDHASHEETIPFALRGGGLYGALLKACGKLDEASLEAGLREQTALRLIEIFRAVGHTSRFAFYRDSDLLASWGGTELTPVDPWWVLWWGSRDCEPDEFVRTALGLLGDETLALEQDTPWERFGFDSQEMEFLAWWSDRPSTIRSLLSQPLLSSNAIEMIIYVLFLTRRLNYEEAVPTRIRKAPEQTEVRQPFESDTEVFTQHEIEQAAASYKSSSQESLSETTEPGQAPNFPPEDQDDIEIPITVCNTEVEIREVLEPPASDRVSDVSARMTLAFQTLLDPVERGEEEQAPPRGPTTSQLDLGNNLKAMRLSSQSYTAMRKGDFEEAERFAVEALEMIPDNAQLMADFAWAAFHTPARRKIGDVGDLLDVLKDATEKDPALDRPYFVRGVILQYLGLHGKAYGEFRAAFARNAHNTEAAEKVGEYVRRLADTGTLEPDGKPKSDRNVGVMGIPARAGEIISRFWKRS